jgi:hypothetical protein
MVPSVFIVLPLLVWMQMATSKAIGDAITSNPLKCSRHTVQNKVLSVFIAVPLLVSAAKSRSKLKIVAGEWDQF